MGPALLVWVLLFIFPLSLLFVAAGLMAVVLRPDRLRPPWWDWGMDKPVSKTEAAPEVSAKPIEAARPMKAESLPIIEAKTAAKTARPRW